MEENRSSYKKLFSNTLIIAFGSFSSKLLMILLVSIYTRYLSEAELARRMGISPQNLHNKMKRDNFYESELRQIAEALGLRLEISFINPETGEKV